jgi:hypothetical protein
VSKGISWRQHWMLKHLDRLNSPYPVAWRVLDFGPGHEDSFDDPDVAWNLEQSQRRSLRNLEDRGLVRLERCSFSPGEGAGEWEYRIGYHMPGQDRIMTGVVLTKEGRRVARQQRRRSRSL